MFLNNLTRDEARERARLLRITSYQVQLDLSVGETTFLSRTLVRFTCREPGLSTFIELTASAVQSITLNEKTLNPAEVFDGNRIWLPRLAPSNQLEVVANCAYSRTGGGLHRFVDPVDGSIYMYTQFETYDAHRVYACFDQPDLKASFELSVIAPHEWLCISNGQHFETIEKGGGRVEWRFTPTPIVSTYITALVTGPYYEVRDAYDGIELGLYSRRSLAEFLDPEQIFQITRQGLDFYHDLFGYRYPFGKYDQLFVPEFNFGAMENAGCVTITEDYVFRAKVPDTKRERRAEMILHEMAHMWFGNLVTMRWWDDLWLNESFATYVAFLAQATSTRFKNAWTTFANVKETWAYRADQFPTSHPISADAPDIETVETNFDGITYAKGASVLKQLVSWVGQEQFVAGVQSYLRQHQYNNAALQDLLHVLEIASDRDLGAWSKEWLETSGINTLRPRFDVDLSGSFTKFNILQEAPKASPTLRSHRLAIGLYDRQADGALVRRDRLEVDILGQLTEVPALVGVRRPDLVLVNDDDLTYAKIRFDEQSFGTLVTSIGSIRESLPRALCWAAVWDMTRDAEMRTRDYISFVFAGIEDEDNVGVVQSILLNASIAVDLYLDPTQRPAALRELASRAYELLQTADPGGDFQLVYTHAFAEAEDPPQVDKVKAILEGREVIEGLQLDTELRWRLLSALVANGALGDEAIEAELARDPTAMGHKHAATARSLRPTAQAKAEAWATVVESDRLSNDLQAAVMAGFWRASQVELCRPYVERYFAEIGEVWRTRTIKMAQKITSMLYPSLVVEQDTIDRTNAYLIEENPQPALRRALIEGRDSVERAMRARWRDRRGSGD